MAGDTTQPSDRVRPSVGSFEGTAAFGGDVHMRGEFVAGHDIRIGKLVRNTVLPAPPPPPPTRLQLPPDLGDFTGRTAELARLQELLEQARTQSPMATPVLLVNGMPGVGKSALALHLAHVLKPDYPDAQLYVRLSGVGEPPVSAADALDRLLRALGMDPERLPAVFEERLNLYRTLLAAQRVLVMLDNALDREQVKPLRPTSAGSLVLVTSRSDLPGMEGISAYRLQPMVAREGVELLSRLLGAERVAADHDAAERVVTLCGRLPLAIRLAGASLATTATRSWPLGRLVERLADARGRLDALADEADERRAVRASFELSYQQLPKEQARVFRWLSLLQVRDLGAQVVAALVDAEQSQVEAWLHMLVNAQLVDPMGSSGERYRVHDLLALYGSELAEQDPAKERQAAVRRALGWYLEQTEQMDKELRVRRADLEELAQGDSDLAEQARADPAALQATLMREALGWFEAERTNLVAIQRQAAELDELRLVWRIAVGLFGFFDQRKQWHDWQTTHERALLAARELGDRAAEEKVLIGLGVVYGDQRRLAEALDSFQQSLAIARELDDRHQESAALNALGVAYTDQRRLAEALDSFQQSLAIARELGDCYREGQVLCNLGTVYVEQWRLKEAVDTYEEGLAIHRELGERHGEGTILGNLGIVYRKQRRLAEALGSFQQALAIRRELGDRYGEGMDLSNLGTLYADQWRLIEAVEGDQQSLAIHKELGDRYSEAQVLGNLGIVYLRQGRFRKALNTHQQSLAIFRELGDRYGEAQALDNLGIVYAWQRRFGEAFYCQEESLAIFRELGDRNGEAQALGSLGFVYSEQGQSGQALYAYHQHLSVCRELGDRHGEAQALGNLGTAYARQRQFGEALDCYQQHLSVCRELGDRHGEAQALGSLGIVYARQERFGEAFRCQEESLAIFRELGDRYGEAWNLGHLGNLYAEQGARHRAEQYFTQALAIFQELRAPEGEQFVAGLAKSRRRQGLRSRIVGWRRR